MAAKEGELGSITPVVAGHQQEIDGISNKLGSVQGYAPPPTPSPTAAAFIYLLSQGQTGSCCVSQHGREWPWCFIAVDCAANHPPLTASHHKSYS